MTTITVSVCDDGPLGAVLTTSIRPRGCPGLGGWKRNADGDWWTRVKGQLAGDLIVAADRSPVRELRITLDGDRIARWEVVA